MLVTLLGMVMEVRLLQTAKASDPIFVTLDGIMVFLHPATNVFEAVSIMALQLLRESYLLLAASTTMELSPLQSEKTSIPMLVTLLGMVTRWREAFAAHRCNNTFGQGIDLQMVSG